MTRAAITVGALATLLSLLALALRPSAPERAAESAAATAPLTVEPTTGERQGLLYGRVNTDDGATYEGRLRFGDIARLEARGRDLQVTLKSGTVFHLDRHAADDYADGVRVWGRARGVVDLREGKIRSIELLPTVPLGSAPSALHGTARRRQGEFTGLVQWNRQGCMDADELTGRSLDGYVALAFSTIRSIARHSRESALVTLRDGREIVLSGTRDAGNGNRGMSVDDPRYGRALVSWDAFERVDFSPGPAAPSYADFPAGGPLTGTVVTRSGRRLAGRLGFDLDESETTETLEAPSQGVDYTIPFGLIASIAPPGLDERGARRVRVTLHGGEELNFERAGDVGEGNGGLLIFLDAAQRPEHVPWRDVERIDFDPPPAFYPAPGPGDGS
ncbi:MAG TPA: hypothetical protein VLH75_01800 [Longimicrobiales bacterium]|nr:hypothetical protein [Longimicrobiales bacterium]